MKSKENISETMDQVQELQDLFIRKSRFYGYSGWARMACGILTLSGAAILAWVVPPVNLAHLIGWGIVLLLGLNISYTSMAWWFVSTAGVRENPSRLKPALDALPALAAGAVVSAALIANQQFNLLFGIWMMMYGLAQTNYRTALPRTIFWTGCVYMICGAMLIVYPLPFTNPWPMGITFFLGECAGGIRLLQQEEEDR